MTTTVAADVSWMPSVVWSYDSAIISFLRRQNKQELLIKKDPSSVRRRHGPKKNDTTTGD